MFLRYTKLGWAVRATAQDRDAAMQMGVDVDRVNQAVFGIAAALGGVSGLLVGMYYNQIDTAMSLQATLKGVVAGQQAVLARGSMRPLATELKFGDEPAKLAPLELVTERGRRVRL